MLITKPLTKHSETYRPETELNQRFKEISDTFLGNIEHFDSKVSADKAQVADKAFVTAIENDKLILYRKINGKLMKVGG